MKTITLEKSRLNNIHELKIEVEYRNNNILFTADAKLLINNENNTDSEIYVNDKYNSMIYKGIKKFINQGLSSMDNLTVTITALENNIGDYVEIDVYRLSTFWNTLEYRPFNPSEGLYLREFKEEYDSNLKLSNTILKTIKQIKAELDK